MSDENVKPAEQQEQEEGPKFAAYQDHNSNWRLTPLNKRASGPKYAIVSGLTFLTRDQAEAFAAFMDAEVRP